MDSRKFFGEGCEHFSGQWESGLANEPLNSPRPGREGDAPILVHCSHYGNLNQSEGNCNPKMCPLGLADLSVDLEKKENPQVWTSDKDPMDFLAIAKNLLAEGQKTRAQAVNWLVNELVTHKGAAKDLLNQVSSLESERDSLKENLQTVRSLLKTQNARASVVNFLSSRPFVLTSLWTVVPAALWFLLWGLGSFIGWEGHASNWDGSSRGVFVAVWVAASAITCGAITAFTKKDSY